MTFKTIHQSILDCKIEADILLVSEQLNRYNNGADPREVAALQALLFSKLNAIQIQQMLGMIELMSLSENLEGDAPPINERH